MESIEQTGRTVEDAVKSALKVLGVAREQVDIEVLSQETRGLLGILGYSEAKVRVTVKPGAAPAPPAPEREPAPEHILEELEAEPLQEEAEPSAPIAEPSPLAVHARDLTAEILRLMEVTARPEVVAEDAETVEINIRESSDLGLLIGKHGQTLSSLQLIVAMMVNRTLPQEERKRIVLDAAGYRERREQALTAMARHAADRAKRTGREVPLQPLNARERRVVHLALAEDAEVSTRSEGEEPERHIVIVPKHRRREPRSPMNRRRR
jgi:spoIIIJ-associated protein